MDCEKSRIGMRIKCMDHLIRRKLELSVRNAGVDSITLMHGWIIRYLYENKDQEIYQKDIEETFFIGRSSVTNIIQLMEKKGYLCRKPVAHDARLKQVVLSEKGIQVHKQMEELVHELDEQIMAGISEEEWHQFYLVTEKIIANVQTDEKKENGEES